MQSSSRLRIRDLSKYPPKNPILKGLWDKSRGVEECFFVAEGSEEGLGTEQASNRLSRHERAVLRQQKVDWDKIKAYIPHAVEEVMGDEPEIMTEFLKFIQAGINSARGDDTKDLKPAILDLIPQKYLSGPANEDGEKSIWSLVPTNARTEKGLRGFANRITGRLLCPIDYVRDFDADPNETIEKLKNGSFSRLDREGVPKFPSFMYDEDMMERGKLTNGLFRGPLLVAVHMHIFTSRSVAMGGKKTAQKGIGEKHHMEHIDPATICYAAIQTWVAVSDMREWSKTDRGVDLSILYTAFHQLLGLERGKDPWVDATLDWWNSQLRFGGTTGDGIARGAGAPSMLETLDVERRQRVAEAS